MPEVVSVPPTHRAYADNPYAQLCHDRPLFVFDCYGAALFHRSINRIDNNDVAQSLFATRFRLSTFLDTGGKSVQFQYKFVNGFERLGEPLPAHLSTDPPFFLESKCRS